MSKVKEFCQSAQAWLGEKTKQTSTKVAQLSKKTREKTIVLSKHTWEYTKKLAKQSVELSKQSTIMVNAIVRQHKAISISVLAALVLFVGSTAIGVTYYKSQVHAVYHVYFHGKHIGTVDNPAVVHQWLKDKVASEAAKFEHVNLKTDNAIRFEGEEIYRPEFDNTNVLSALEEMYDLQATAVKVEIDGQFIGYVADQETLSNVLDAFKKQFVSEDILIALEERQDTKKSTMSIASITETGDMDVSGIMEEDGVVLGVQSSPLDELQLNTPQIADVRIKQNVQVASTTVHPEEVMSEEKLLQILSQTSTEQAVYHVQAGDVLGTIAQKHGLTTAELLRLNPNLTENSVLQIGQEIIVMAEEPFISIITVERVKQEEVISFSTERKRTDELFTHQQRVEQRGKTGLKNVVYEIIKENGQPVEKVVIEEDILEEPVNEIIQVGTKVQPSRGTGKLAWPAVGGRITSGYGMRWGSMHSGIDIAGVSDRGILAADNGKVITATYHSGYGNYIVIDHNNGYRTLYAHLSKINVSVGQTVAKGQRIGIMGSTGHSTGIHLHFEVIHNGRNVNPLSHVSR